MAEEPQAVTLYFHDRQEVGDEEAALRAFIWNMKDFDVSEKESRRLVEKCPDIITTMIECLNRFV